MWACGRELAFALLVLSFSCSTPAADKKFIELGWDMPSTKFLRAHWHEMEKEGPFDGVIFRVEAKTDDGKEVSTQSGWNREAWKRSWFEPAIENLKACRFEQFTHNFVQFNATPKIVAWDDDEGWRAIENKLRICAWLAREGGAKGIAPDFEPYGENQWKFDPARGRSFSATAALARQRGAQFARGIAAEMPDAVVLTLFLNSVVLPAGRATDPAAMLARQHYGLLPAFLDGILDAAPPQMIILDGCETGYYLDSVEAYQREAIDLRSWTGPAIKLVAPENRAKYRQQVQVGFGFYLDMFINEPGNSYYRPPLDGSRLKRLERNLRAAHDAADEYVWIYGEQCRWWSGLAQNGPWREEQLKKTVGKGRTWEKALPGVMRAIRWVRDPETSARAEVAALKESRAATNVVVNADFAEKPKAETAMPAGWTAWQDEKHPTGRFERDDTVGGGTARAIQVKWGCFLQKIAVAPGQVFAVGADCRTKGSTLAGLTVRWQTEEDKWAHEADDCHFQFAGAADWKSTFGIVTVPPGTSQLVLLLDVRDQKTGEDVCWFDNVKAYRLETTF